ncbi:MFS transporter [Wenjunlia tyrosinilytica]|uniref:Major facilitator superfamily (MFS) profile domain-containing protein n=1 Tax=Wenjunlia tyrosinilytica TaxID=1544741 RepID=A0A918E0R8_9ACTN|nr:MFS transporter [Wenjunlia tyrosinilytica]GGO95453.1 hypothetical protein GCM10012280_52680 [Wenjunlia tyrosinilytica]
MTQTTPFSTATPPPRRAASPATVMLITAGATFMAFLDTTVVNIAFPDLRRSFPDVAVSDLSWVVSSYAVLFAALLTTAGRLADTLGRRRIFLISISAFTVASALCAAAPTIEFLVASRALQGAAAAGMIPAALGLLLAEVPAERLASAVGAWGASGSLATAAGPSLGGILVEAFDWRSVFLINIPLGLVLLWGTLKAVPERHTGGGRLPDLTGTGAVTAGVGLLVLGLTKGSDWGWSSAGTYACVLTGAALLALALLRSRTHGAPAVETALWGNRTFAVANVASLMSGAALFAWMLAGPLFLTSVWGYSVLSAGFAVTPGALASAVAALAVGRRAKPHHLPYVVAFGMASFAGVALWMWAGLGAEPSFVTRWLPMGLVGGTAFGATMTALSTAAAASVPPRKFASGIGLTTTARQLGGALGVAAMAAIVAARGLGGPQAFLDVFLFCALASGAAAVAGLGLRWASRGGGH